MSDTSPVPSSYDSTLANLKEQVLTARFTVQRSVNKELVGLYWQIGDTIAKRQAAEGWGSKVIARLAGDLRKTFPDMKGFSPRNLTYMRTFAGA